MHVHAISGSLRARSLNTALLRTAVTHLPAHTVVTWEDGLRDLPHYDQDLEDAGGDPRVHAFTARLAAADAILVAAPMYNGGMTSSLKNALDWASRPFRQGPLVGTPAAVVGASPGKGGASGAVEQCRLVLRICGARLTEAVVTVPAAHEVIDHERAVVPPDIDAALAALVAELVSLVEAPAPTPG